MTARCTRIVNYNGMLRSSHFLQSDASSNSDFSRAGCSWHQPNSSCPLFVRSGSIACRSAAFYATGRASSQPGHECNGKLTVQSPPRRGPLRVGHESREMRRIPESSFWTVRWTWPSMEALWTGGMGSESSRVALASFLVAAVGGQCSRWQCRAPLLPGGSAARTYEMA